MRDMSQMVRVLEYEIEIIKSSNKYVAVINSYQKPVQERDARTIEELLDIIAREIQEDDEDK